MIWELTLVIKVGIKNSCLNQAIEGSGAIWQITASEIIVPCELAVIKCWHCGHWPLCLCFWHSALIMDSSIQQKLIHVIFILSYNWPYRIDLFVPKSIWTLKILNLQIGWVQDQKLFSSEDSSTCELILPFMFLSYILNGAPIISTLRNTFPVRVSGSHFLSKL